MSDLKGKPEVYRGPQTGQRGEIQSMEKGVKRRPRTQATGSEERHGFGVKVPKSGWAGKMVKVLATSNLIT